MAAKEGNPPADTTPAVNYKIIWLGLLFGIGFYVADIIMDVYVFQSGTLIEEFLHPTFHETWMRLTVLILVVVFSIYVQILLQREHAISERAKTAERFLNSVVDNIPGMIFIKDSRELRFVRVNRAGEKLLGLKTEELIGHNDYDFFPEKQADFFTKMDHEVLESGIEMDIPDEEINTMQLGLRWLHTRKVPILDDQGNAIYLLGISEDITEVKHAESALQETEVRFRTLFDSAADFIFVIDPAGRVKETNRHACEHSGYLKDEIVGKNIKDFFTPESQNTCDCNFPGLRERGFNRADIEFVCKDGHIIQMECTATGVPDENGDFTSFLIIQRDVTGRARAAAALANSERRFRAIFNSTFQFIGLLDPDGVVLEANKTVRDFLGRTESDLVGKPIWEVMWQDIPPEEQERIKASIREAAHGKLVRNQVDMVGENNKVRTIDFSLKPVQNEQGETVLIIPEGRDITDLKLAEEELRRHQQEMAHVMRLSTMGEMASGMAHELNQPLTALVSYCGTAATLANAHPSSPQKLGEILERAMEQAHRAGEIIRHLREFVRKGDDHREPLDLDQVIQEMSSFLQWELRHGNAVLKHNPGCQGREVMANKVQVEQVLVNLVRNSLEAIQGSGTTEGKVVVQTRRLPNDTVETSVTDNGPGIDADMAGKIFDPFQTSKTSGMGMGLSISRSIIEAHDGKLWIDEQCRNGASLVFSLPVA